ncbi:MAG: hypothetical protein ACJAZ9_002086 [Neolewinella sp.]|jgi:hypothetical protein
MSFKPFHVYELDSKLPVAKLLPFTYFLCMTLPQEAAFSVRHNIVGFPILPGLPRRGAESLRHPIYSKGQDRSQLDISGAIHIGIDLLQPLNYDMFLPQSRGQILEKEKSEVIEKLKKFLAIE